MTKTNEKTGLKYTKIDDLQGIEESIDQMDLSPFVGKWDNTKSGSGQLPYVELRTENGELYLKAFGADEDGLTEWGEVKCQVFSGNIHDGTAIAFTTGFTFDEIDVDITANVKLGVLVIQTYTTFKDGSQRLNFYAREFYGPAQ